MFDFLDIILGPVDFVRKLFTKEGRRELRGSLGELLLFVILPALIVCALIALIWYLDPGCLACSEGAQSSKPAAATQSSGGGGKR